MNQGLAWVRKRGWLGVVAALVAVLIWATATGDFSSKPSSPPTAHEHTPGTGTGGGPPTGSQSGGGVPGGIVVGANALTATYTFSISGNITTPFYPGVSQKLDLVFTNPNPVPITIPAGGVTITLSTRRAGCPSSPNFKVDQSVTTSVTLPKKSTVSLSRLGVTMAEWPVITMVDTPYNQDACEGAVVTLRYSAVGT